MAALDDECKHGLPLGTCTYCSGQETAARIRGTQGGGLQRSLDMPKSVDTNRSLVSAWLRRRNDDAKKR